MGALFIVDEVQTGCGATGSVWAYPQLGLQPDLVAFGKKTQVCEVMAGRRIELVPEHVFRVSSRVSSAWGGNLTDMVRATRILQVIEEQQLIAAARVRGAQLLVGLQSLAAAYPAMASNPRGRGLMCASDLPDPESRDQLVRELHCREQVLVLPCGEHGVRFRPPPLSVTEAEIDRGLEAVAAALRTVRVPVRHG